MDQQTEVSPPQSHTEKPAPSPTSPRSPEQTIDPQAQEMASAIQKQRLNDPDQALAQVAAGQTSADKKRPINPQGVPLSQAQISEGKRLIAAKDRGDHPISYLGLDPQQQDQLVAAVRNYQARAEPLRVDKTLSAGEQARQAEAAAAAHGMATHIHQSADQNPDVTLQAIAGSETPDQATANSNPKQRKQASIPEQQPNAKLRAEIRRVVVGNTEIPVYSNTESLSLSRANEIVYPATGHAANLQELQTIITGMEELNRESFPDDDVYNQGLTVVMRELDYWNSDMPKIIENGATVDGKSVNTEVITNATKTRRPTKEELEKAWQLMANTPRGKVMEMLAYLQDYRAVTTGKFEPYQKAMPESRKKELAAKAALNNPESKLSPKERWKKAIEGEKLAQELQQLRDEFNSLSPSEIQTKIEEFVGLNMMISEQPKQDAKALAETIAQMANIGKIHNNQELQEIAAYYYGAFKMIRYPYERTRFPSSPRLYFSSQLQEEKGLNAGVVITKTSSGEVIYHFSPGAEFAKIPSEARMVTLAHEYQHCRDFDNGLPLGETFAEKFANETMTEINAHMYAYRIYQQLQQYFPDFRIPKEDEYAEFINEKGSVLEYAITYVNLIRNNPLGITSEQI